MLAGTFDFHCKNKNFCRLHNLLWQEWKVLKKLKVVLEIHKFYNASLFFVMGHGKYLCYLLPTFFFAKFSYCFWPKLSHRFLNLVFGHFFNIKSIKITWSSWKGLPKSNIVALNLVAFSRKSFLYSWCVCMVEKNPEMLGKSSTSLLISGSATIRLLRAAGSYVRHTTPPSSFTTALFCSCIDLLLCLRMRLNYGKITSGKPCINIRT